MATVKKLGVYREGDLVGTLMNETPIKFIYAHQWQSNHHTGISPQLPLSQAEHSGAAVESYFENLLPEAGIRELLKLKHQATSTFGLLSVIGGDTASDLTILPDDETPQPPQYQPITWQDIAEEFTHQQGIIRTIQEEDGLRVSLAGAQRKLSIHIDHDGNLLLPLGSAPSTYIIKPDIRDVEGVWASAINETCTMTLADRLGLGVAEVSYQPIAKACVIKRYDRTIDTHGRIKRLHQLDLCQIDGKPSTTKYESDGGPTLLRCREMLQECGVTAADTKRFIQWLFFNLYVGNNDSHAKNLSIYYTAEGEVRLTPFYDILSTSVYPGLSRKFAFNIGGENKPSNIHQDQVTQMARSWGSKSKYILTVAEDIAVNLLATLSAVAEEMNAIASPGTEKTMIDRLHQHIASNTQRFQHQLFKENGHSFK
ncbi:serine/threonine-protein kinase HipA [Methylophilus rhizosphaerae]|uniref:Serine/threonine-protein kinase HipA n=1 Tax=Methylophilus rhizosphaerae TaxID=492660 RepID=A0A1G8ZGS3_9PROT|nr:type II toxin-antitoxin system HipA family toxin [Methylophilus rhizosphaerae]SDK14193.1 serine/threonine-protein kinase HipA [Methylophilus rhizosphaerae]